MTRSTSGIRIDLASMVAPVSAVATAEADEFIELCLPDFCVYRAVGHPQGPHCPYKSLMTVASEGNRLYRLFDGAVEHNGIQRRIMEG